MIQRMRQAQDKLLREVWERRNPDLPLKSPDQLVVLASIIEKETSKPEERTRIAAVFVNRLKQKMKLQTDPTVIYGLVFGKGSLGRPLTRSDIAQPTPYNTYVIDGLPPGPIANPGRASIEAAATPARTKELYFAADGTGGHAFAETYEREHRPGGATAIDRTCCAGGCGADRAQQAQRQWLIQTGRNRAIGSSPAVALSSMTGFARGHGVCGAYGWTWELKSVNAKGLDLRLRLPPGWESVEAPVRTTSAQVLARGTIHGLLSVDRQGIAPIVRVNEAVLAAVLDTMKSLAGRLDAAEPRLDGILSLKGVMEVIEPDEREEDRMAAEAAVIAGFRATIAELAVMRRREGEVLQRVLSQRIREIAALAARADAAPGRRPEAIKARIREQVAMLLDASNRFDPDRLHQEAILIASKADIREEVDRLASHVAQVERLIGEGGAVGRRLDFLAQELNREANTLCSKSNDVELTNIGLELKGVVEQFREQVQNLE